MRIALFRKFGFRESSVPDELASISGRRCEREIRMSDALSDSREGLIRALMGLPSVPECEVVLRAGRLPIDESSLENFENGFLSIRHEYQRRVRIREQPLATAFGRLARISNCLLEALQTDAGRQVLEMMETQIIFGGEVAGYVLGVNALHDKALSHYRIAHMPRTDFENWVFQEVYVLYARLKGSRPGNAAPLYEFTKKCTKLVGMRFVITKDAFRMRVERLPCRRRKQTETLPAVQ